MVSVRQLSVTTRTYQEGQDAMPGTTAVHILVFFGWEVKEKATYLALTGTSVRIGPCMRVVSMVVLQAFAVR